MGIRAHLTRRYHRARSDSRFSIFGVLAWAVCVVMPIFSLAQSDATQQWLKDGAVAAFRDSSPRVRLEGLLKLISFRDLNGVSATEIEQFSSLGLPDPEYDSAV